MFSYLTVVSISAVMTRLTIWMDLGLNPKKFGLNEVIVVVAIVTVVALAALVPLVIAITR